MAITYIRGDMFFGNTVFAHGCNAQGVMGSGVAKIIRDKYPFAYEAYRNAYKTSGLKVGQVVWAEQGDVLIANAITQEFYGREPKRYVDYDGVGAAMREINKVIAERKDKTICMPMIGAGLGNGDWEIISQIINDECRDIEVNIYILSYDSLIKEK